MVATIVLGIAIAVLFSIGIYNILQQFFQGNSDLLQEWKQLCKLSYE